MKAWSWWSLALHCGAGRGRGGGGYILDTEVNQEGKKKKQEEERWKKDRFLTVLLDTWVQSHLKQLSLSSYLSPLSYLCAQTSLSSITDIYHLSSSGYMPLLHAKSINM